ncbi:hypothetical protein FB440_101145 [Vibrio crassostreae]|uniref:hypothetical protein n=1 Tax=Vibrio crassostreae TaxID=246167 RepID=UPI000F47AF6C|nr:hypothetical protein [Vibrio crassostreae]ROR22268.1 hypothetical protein EDB67_10996 [Vibrio crassostreae]TCN66985.1 hypothetical protein EDB60_110176 [Vibrio crassostreae]TWD43232.1 hypothetical protein FB440_101145 [Vibrio crassostreae]
MKNNNLGSFRDAQGNIYEILEKVAQISTKPLSGSYTNHDGFKSYETTCGIPVNVKNGEFVTWKDVVLKPVD